MELIEAHAVFQKAHVARQVAARVSPVLSQSRGQGSSYCEANEGPAFVPQS